VIDAISQSIDALLAISMSADRFTNVHHAKVRSKHARSRSEGGDG